MRAIRVHEIPLDSALDLMDALNPSSGLFPGGAIFRGQANASWGLLPSVFRNDVPYLLPEDSYPRTRLVYGSQVKLEIELLWLFVGRANESGLVISGDSEAIRESLDHIR